MSRLDPDALMQQISHADATTDVRLLLAELMNSWGGQKAFSDELVESARNAESGSSAHLGVMTAVLRAYLQHGHVGDDEEGADEESVRATMRTIIAEDQGDATGHGASSGDDCTAEAAGTSGSLPETLATGEAGEATREAPG